MNGFEVFTGTAQRDTIEDAVLILLRGDDELAAYFDQDGAGGMWRQALPDRLSLDDVANLPLLTVASRTWGQQLQLSEETEITLTVLVTVVYNEPRPHLDVGDRTVSCAIDRVAAVLAGNDQLVLAEYSNDPLVERLDSFAVVDFGTVLGDGPEEGETAEVARFITLGINYTYLLKLSDYQRP